MVAEGPSRQHVVIGRDLSPARLVVPDPRWFALQKLWLSDQVKRNPLKRGKDRRQGIAILDTVMETMPQFALDIAFEAEIPGELVPYYQQWKSREARPQPTRRW